MTRSLSLPRRPTLAQRAFELNSLHWPGATLRTSSGRELRFRFQISPGAFGRVYDCVLILRADGRAPDALVLKPDLIALAGGRRPPHLYAHVGLGVKLCLWWPKQREWLPHMKMVDSYLAWTAEWLWYFEDWLATGEWSGGGEHPIPPTAPPLRERLVKLRAGQPVLEQRCRELSDTSSRQSDDDQRVPN